MKKVLIITVIIIAILLAAFGILKYLGGYPVGFEGGRILVKKYYCSDVCPAYGHWNTVYSRIKSKQECDKIGGRSIVDPAWGGFEGCAPLEEKDIDDAIVEADDWKNYANADYGFQLTLTEAWKGYNVKLQETSSNFGQGSLIFCVPTVSKNYGNIGCEDGFARIMVVYVMNQEQWNWWQKQEGPKPSLLGQNSNHIFGYSFWQDPPQDLISTDFETNKVLASFKSI